MQCTHSHGGIIFRTWFSVTERVLNKSGDACFIRLLRGFAAVRFGVAPPPPQLAKG